DGWCDQDNNNEICGYDGGDCCECTCAVSSSKSTAHGTTTGLAAITTPVSTLRPPVLTTT
ncbi:unnamed protein product, partial [Ectocarpus sp. 12 AP-2014]